MDVSHVTRHGDVASHRRSSGDQLAMSALEDSTEVMILGLAMCPSTQDTIGKRLDHDLEHRPWCPVSQ